MTDQTKIEWADFTVNFWEGCQKVGLGCDNCYAEARDVRFTGGSHWGPGAPRRKVKAGIPKLRKINADAGFREAHGRPPRVFCSSLSDVFDNAVPEEWRVEAFTEIDRATDTRPMLLTKRVGNVEKMIPPMWRDGAWPQHVGLMITVVNQDEADRDVPKLLDLKARLDIPWVGLSMEPLLGPVDLEVAWHGTSALEAECWGECGWCDLGFPPLHNCQRGRQSEAAFNRGRDGVDWIIAGGESGPNARPSNPQWFRDLRDQCDNAGVSFLFKQWGEWEPNPGPIGTMLGMKGVFSDRYDDTCGWPCLRVGKKRAGRLLDGVTHDGFPEALT